MPRFNLWVYACCECNSSFTVRPSMSNLASVYVMVSCQWDIQDTAAFSTSHALTAVRSGKYFLSQTAFFTLSVQSVLRYSRLLLQPQWVYWVAYVQSDLVNHGANCSGLCPSSPEPWLHICVLFTEVWNIYPLDLYISHAFRCPKMYVRLYNEVEVSAVCIYTKGQTKVQHCVYLRDQIYMCIWFFCMHVKQYKNSFIYIIWYDIISYNHIVQQFPTHGWAP